jgi:hypothetical protein
MDSDQLTSLERGSPFALAARDEDDGSPLVRESVRCRCLDCHVSASLARARTRIG